MRPAAARGPGASGALCLLLLAASALAAGDDVAAHRECGYCGMDRRAYGYSRVLVRYEDGAEVGVCSLRCALVELDAHPGRPARLLVADRDTRALVAVEEAAWVVGGRKRGVMTTRAKWAFATPAAAAAFVAANGGEVVDWPRALAAAREDLAKDLEVERTERRPRPMGCAGPAGAARG